MAGAITPPSRLVPGLIEPAGGKALSVTKNDAVAEPKFNDLVKEFVETVNRLGQESTQVQEAFLSGEPVELHQVMIKAEEAGLSMELLLEIRNRLVVAYQEIMRMPI